MAGCVTSQNRRSSGPHLRILPSGRQEIRAGKNLVLTCRAQVPNIELVKHLKWINPRGQDIPQDDRWETPSKLEKGPFNSPVLVNGQEHLGWVLDSLNLYKWDKRMLCPNWWTSLLGNSGELNDLFPYQTAPTTSKHFCILSSSVVQKYRHSALCCYFIVIFGLREKFTHNLLHW